MLEIEKGKTEWAKDNYYHFIITTDEGKFEISFAGNLDLYWRYMYQGNVMDEPESKSFTITKENYYLYSLFKVLYEDVKNCNIFVLNEIDISFCEDEEEIETKRKDFERWNNDLKKQQEYNPERLFHNGAIEWHCDDFPYDEAGVIRIEQKEDTFGVTIKKSKEVDTYLTYSVRFRNSGSRYNPFNQLFMKMYNKLIDYEPECHQVHIEEYLYQKKLEKKI